MKSFAGFTLVELNIVTIIILLLSTLVLANYREGEKQFSLLRSANKLAQDLRNTERMAMASQVLPPSFGGGLPKGGYGIYFENNFNSYILFADCDGDKEYDASGPATSCAEASPIAPYPEKINELFLEKNVKISNLSPSSPLSITFFPPDPTITIKPLANLAIITLILSGKTKDVKINTAGLIDID
jgi:type II secretory pathway pseudopilin PulG